MKTTIVKELDKQKNTIVEKPQWTLDEIALSQNTTDQIEEMIAYVYHHKKLLIEWQFNRFLKIGHGLSINFFGLSGTGKSITAEAIAKRLEMGIIKVNFGDLESELYSKTSQNLVATFELARETKSLLFFDEADALLSRRISNLSHAADHGVNLTKSTLLTLLDKFNGVTIFATNLFENYDPAFLRRIIFNVEFPVPNLEMRIQLWKLHLSEPMPKTVTYQTAAEISKGLCGGDIRNIAIKLGLKLLVGKATAIDEKILAEEIDNYKIIKQRNQNFQVIEEETTEPLVQEPEMEH